mgnify:CR=1 FL=1
MEFLVPDSKAPSTDSRTRRGAATRGRGDGGAPARLGRDDWIRAAYQMLGEGGAASLSVERLAERLGVTKGSFYWHFKDRADLLDALRARWTEQLVIGRVEEAGGTPSEKIQNLLNIVVRSSRQRRGGSLELAMRSWARRDAETARVVEAADQARLDYTRRLFEELGFAPKEAEARSFLLYAYIFCQGVFTFSDEAALQARIHALCCELIAAEEEIAS